MALVILPDKVCSHCGGIEWKTEERKTGYGVKIRYRCAKKARERYKRYHENHPGIYTEYYKKRARQRTLDGYFKTEKHKEKQKERSKRQSQTLCDNYVLNKIVMSSTHSLKRSEIPQKLLDLKRKQLILHRQLKQLQNETH